MEKQAVLVSVCLLGVNCRYNGSAGMLAELSEMMQCAQMIPVCPEILGGLPTPRPPAERVGEKVLSCEGGDVTQAYLRGAQETLKLAKLYGAKYAVLKERSPSCGAGEIYDGTFSHSRIPGDGVAAALLKAHGVQVYGESRVGELMKCLKEGNKNDTIQL